MIKKENISIRDFFGIDKNQNEIEPWSDSAARQSLIFWAILTYNNELVEYLWRKSDDPIAWALGEVSIFGVRTDSTAKMRFSLLAHLFLLI